MIRAVERKIWTLAHFQIFHALRNTRMRHVGHDKHARSNTLADGIINHTDLRQHAAVLLRDQGFVELVERCSWTVHTGFIGDKTCGVGNSSHFDHGF
ncbi:hypothetical protein FQZ97_824960 [compost metagenome]